MDKKKIKTIFGAMCSRKPSKSKAGDDYKYKGLCSAKDWKRDPKDTSAIWEMVNQDKVDKELLEEAEQQVKLFLEKLRQGTESRRRTISMLRDLASELEKTRKDVNIAKVTGTSTAVAGGAIAVAGGILSFFTFGLASPLIGIGVGTAVAGGVTTAGAEIADAVISKDKMEAAQKILDDDKRTLEEIDDSYSKLVRISEKITATNPKLGTKEQVLCALLAGSKLKGGGKGGRGLSELEIGLAIGSLLVIGAVLSSVSKEFGKLTGRLLARIGRVLSEGMAKGAGNIARAVLRGATAVVSGVFLAFDIYELVKVSQDIHNGSRSKAADTLREIARKFEEQLRDMEEFLQQIEAHSEELWDLMKKEFRKLLQEIASRGHATREEVNLVWNYLQMCQPSEEWRQAFRDCAGSLTQYVACLATIFNAIVTQVEEQQKKETKKKPGASMDVTFIAHGQVMSPQLPCTLFYMSPPGPLFPGVKSITLYEPWGCAIDASAVYGIAAGLIGIDNVRYSDVVLPSRPSSFNTLPHDPTLIPMQVFTHVKTDETAYAALMAIAAAIGAEARGLVIPYFNPPGVEGLPEIPLWALANVLDIIGLLADIRFRVHVAACLVTYDKSLMRRAYPSLPWPVVDCDQYCTVPVKPDPDPGHVWMSCGLPIPQNLSSILAGLDQFL